MNMRKPTIEQVGPTGNEIYTSEPIASDVKINFDGMLKIEDKFI